MRRVDHMISPTNFATLKAEQLMQDVVSYYHTEDTAEKVAGAITAGNFGSVPILGRDGTLFGLVSEFDLLQVIMEGKELSNVTVAEIMTEGKISVTWDTPVTQILHLLQTKHLIRIPVTDAEGKLVGIVARRDIILGYLRTTKPIWTF